MNDVIDKVLDEFDFESVQKTMHALDWKYWDSEGPVSIGELRRTARYLLKEAMLCKHTIGTGGFEAQRDENMLSLKFVVSEWTEDIE